MAPTPYQKSQRISHLQRVLVAMRRGPMTAVQVAKVTGIHASTVFKILALHKEEFSCLIPRRGSSPSVWERKILTLDETKIENSDCPLKVRMD